MCNTVIGLTEYVGAKDYICRNSRRHLDKDLYRVMNFENKESISMLSIPLLPTITFMGKSVEYVERSSRGFEIGF
jgi:hypothetical protein